ncbi:MAG: AAA family ATPase [Actinomycetota bacterium]
MSDRSIQPLPKSRPKESERTTRKPLGWWDRVKFLLLFGGGWLVLAGSEYLRLAAVRPRYDALYEAVRTNRWLLIAFSVEFVRQMHFLIAEHSKGYFAAWNRVWSTSESARQKVDPWTRYRLGRIAWIAFLLYLVGTYVSSSYTFGSRQISPLEAVLRTPGLIMQGLPDILRFVFIIALGLMQIVALFWFLSKGGVDTYMPDDIETRFSDVKGQDAVLDKVRETMVFLEDPASIEDRGGYVPGGILLWGPPGTGKTLMAQAVAGETAKPFVFVEPGAFINMFMGVGILKVKGLFRKLRKLASRYGGVIVFFDEADSLGNRGQASGGWNAEPGPWTTAPSCNGIGYLSDMGRHTVFDAIERPDPEGGRTDRIFMAPGGGGMGTLQSLLSEMDGLKKPRGFVNRVVRRALGLKPKPPPRYRMLHIFATNQPHVLDEAMLRPGRIDRKYKVGYPHKEGRKETFELYLGKVAHDLSEEQIDHLSTISPYASGAMIKDMVNEALIIAIRDGRESITWRDIIAGKQIKQHGVPDDWEYVQRERHAVAVHEAAHAVTAALLRRHVTIDLATIERRGGVGGFVSSIPLEDLFTSWKSEDEIDVMASLASLAGERMFFDEDSSHGVGGDMQNATRMMMVMEGYASMGTTIASRAVTFGGLRGAQPVEDGTDRQMLDTLFGERVEAGLARLYERVWALLDEHRIDVLAVAHALEAHLTITGEDVRAIIEGHEGSIVDGRIYQDPVFRQQLLAYHESALVAHREHDEIAEPLPQTPAMALPPGGNGHRQPVEPDQETPA